jgi:hypothetical protein
MSLYAPGRYNVRITRQKFGTRGANNTPCFVLDFRVLSTAPDQIEADQEWAVPSEMRELSLWLTEKSIGRTLEDLHALGWGGKKLSELEPSSSPDYFSFKGAEVILHCQHTEGRDGKTREQWSPSEGLKPLSHERLMELDRLAEDVGETNGNQTDQVVGDDAARLFQRKNDDYVPF